MSTELLQHICRNISTSQWKTSQVVAYRLMVCIDWMLRATMSTNVNRRFYQEGRGGNGMAPQNLGLPQVAPTYHTLCRL